MGNAWPQPPPSLLNRLTIGTKITFSRTQYTHSPRATNTALLHMTLKVTQSFGMIDKTERERERERNEEDKASS